MLKANQAYLAFWECIGYRYGLSLLQVSSLIIAWQLSTSVIHDSCLTPFI